MGASGAGKSTLLDILAARIPRSATEGAYLMNGKPVASTFKRVSGYVMQDDALYPLLTVRETLTVSALKSCCSCAVVRSTTLFLLCLVVRS